MLVVGEPVDGLVDAGTSGADAGVNDEVVDGVVVGRDVVVVGLGTLVVGLGVVIVGAVVVVDGGMLIPAACADALVVTSRVAAPATRAPAAIPARAMRADLVVATVLLVIDWFFEY
ncbi:MULTISPECIES: hypothetical protein [Actinosynnema]|uniref:hypothetical protein n=1 Tax=Actinosynnema TaxID=40566 RepID=UPI0020A518EF|nr:hypothetical protein [Actinosynnema pretiosum]MCP2097514.1 hypothetical protein [Actinosynnema pretiosum]